MIHIFSGNQKNTKNHQVNGNKKLKGQHFQNNQLHKMIISTYFEKIKVKSLKNKMFYLNIYMNQNMNYIYLLAL